MFFLLSFVKKMWLFQINFVPLHIISFIRV